MRVLAMLHLYPPYHCAGAEMMVHALLRALVEQGHTVDVVLSREHHHITQPYTVDGVTVHPHHDKGDPVRWLDNPARTPHVLITHLENTDRASILGAMWRVPVIHVAHNTYDTTFRPTLRRPALVVANSHWMAAELTAWWDTEQPDRPTPPVMVIHPPVRAADYYTAATGNRITLINPTVEKGADTFYALAERFPTHRFLAVEGAYGTQVRRSAGNVDWLDHVPGDAMGRRVYAQTRIVLVPSVYESYGRVGVEAACSGIPAIAHPTPGLRESLGDAGRFADRSDTDAWERALRGLLQRRTYAEASRRARDRAAALDPTADLARWVDRVEVIGDARHVRTAHRRPEPVYGHGQLR